MLGKVLNDRYKILKKLGKGGMARVFEAQDLLLDRKVAIKMLRGEFVSDKEFIEKFRHEAKAVARISHPNVVSIFDIGQDDDYHYLVMEDIEGRNLKDIIQDRGSLSVVEALDIANQIVAALVVAHKNNIIHCDIKPHNILINRDKQVKVTDFGIARAVTSSTTHVTDTIMGSAHYFSPEQARGGEIKTHSDLYSVGIVLYEMLTGEVPFTGDSPISVALKHIQNDPQPPRDINPEIPEEVNKLVMKALAKEPEARFSDAACMREEITEALKGVRSNSKTQTYPATDVESDGHTKIMKKSEIQRENRARLSRSEQVEQDKKKRVNGSKSWLVWTAIILIIISVGIGSLVYLYINYTDVPVVEVPDLVGLDYDEAVSMAAQVGLEVEKQNEGIYHEEIPEDKIISQNPGAGERVKQTRKLVVTISRGPRTLVMPDLEGKSLRRAEVILDNEGIQIGSREFVYDEDYQRNIVLDQDPEPEAEIEGDEGVKLIISKGDQPEMVEMPNLIGLNEEEAISRLENNQLYSNNITYRESTRFLKDQVIEQEYKPEQEVPVDTGVDLVVSSNLINPHNLTQHTTTVGINVMGFSRQQVRLVVIDNNGEDVIYEARHEPGDYVRQTVNSVGETTLKVYIDDELVKERQIG